MSISNAQDETPRKRVGLALGGGIVRGLAHIGVLAVLEENHIPVDYVAGTSAGSIIATAFCAGWSAEEIHERALKFRWRHIARPTWPWLGLMSFDRLAVQMVREFGDVHFEDLKIPLTVVATDINTGGPVRFSQGRVAPAVQGSCSLPGLVAPLRLGEHLLCDGGMSDMVPVDVLRDMGAEVVIGVDVFEFKIRRYLGPLGYMLAALEIVLERAGGGIAQADCMITPRLAGKTYLRFSKRREMYELGRQAALEKVACIRGMVYGAGTA